jgi:DnaJ-domain-containing protein 1
MVGSSFNDRDFCQTMQSQCKTTPELDPSRLRHTWPLGEEIQNLMGDEATPDPLFFEESWTLGLPTALKNQQMRRAKSDFQRRAQSDLDSVRTLFFMQQREWFENSVASTDCDADFAPVAIRSDAEWAQQSEQGPAAHLHEQPAPEWSRFSQEREYCPATTDPMTLADARRLLGVTASSPRNQIKAAYRLLVCQWHPDHLQYHGEEVRRIATDQMTEINQAYHMLRDALMQEAA